MILVFAPGAMVQVALGVTRNANATSGVTVPLALKYLVVKLPSDTRGITLPPGLTISIGQVPPP
ncbi:hypothetical protein D3C73_1508400 [compost metagenome]